MRIAILTGGGDVPGLNSCIKAATLQAVAQGWEMIGFRRGWAGPLHINNDNPDASADHMLTLTPDFVRTIDRTGGTILHSSRTNPRKVSEKDLPEFLRGSVSADEKGLFDCTAHILRVIEALKIEALIAIGGDDTLSYAAHLHQQGVPVIEIPKTMDNDVFGTDYCIGFSTALTRSVEAIERLRTPAGSHERIAVVELFGRNCGAASLMAGYLAEADRTLISEVPFEMEKLADFLAQDRKNNPSRYAICVVAEGAQMLGGEIIETGPEDAYGHRKLGGIGEQVGAQIEKLTGLGILNQKLAYIMRGGPPDMVDRLVAKNFGTLAIDLLRENKHGLMLALRDGKYTSVPGDMCMQGVRRVDVAACYDRDAYRPRMAEILGKPQFLG